MFNKRLDLHRSRVNKTFGRSGLVAAIVILVGVIGIIAVSGSSVRAYQTETPVPEAMLGGLPTSVYIGECFDFTVAFDNTSTNPSDVGYGPYIDLIMPFDGNDGANGTDTPDGITFNGATYLGAAVNFIELTFPASGTVVHPLTGLPITGSPGDQLVVLEMPFGSFVPDQPAATVNVNACLSNLADLGVDLPITATAGFQYGNDATGGTPIIQDTPDTQNVTPILMTLTKSFSGTENQTATGPIGCKHGQLMSILRLDKCLQILCLLDNLPNNVVYLGIVSTVPATYTVQDEPPVNEPINGSELRLLFDSVNGDDNVSVTFEFFVPEFDADGNPILPPTTGGCVSIDNDALVESGNWNPIDDRDADDPVYSDDANPDQTFDACALVIHKSVAIFNDDPPTGASANDVLEYGYQVNVSDYFTLGGPGNGPTQAMSLVIDDVFSDGQLFDSTYNPTFTAVDRYATTGSSFTAGAAYTSTLPSVNLVVDDSQQPAGVWPIGSFYQDPRACGDGTTALQFDLSQQLIDDARLGVTFNVIDGGIDIVEDSVIDVLDVGVISATDIISGGVDLNGDSVIDTLDAGTFFGYTVIDGYLDIDGSTVVDAVMMVL